jgi:hypothetical protein
MPDPQDEEWRQCRMGDPNATVMGNAGRTKRKKEATEAASSLPPWARSNWALAITCDDLPAVRWLYRKVVSIKDAHCSS